MTDSPPAAWIGGLVLCCAGAILALVGTTLPWAMVSSGIAGDFSYTVHLTDFPAMIAPSAALVLVVTFAAIGISFAGGKGYELLPIPLLVAVLIGSVGAASFLFVTVYGIRGGVVVLRQPSTGLPMNLVVGAAAPTTGAGLYLGGLVMGLFGAGITGFSAAVEMPRAVAVLRLFAYRLLIAVALLCGVIAFSSPWYSLEDTATLDPAGASVADVELWTAGFRIGLIACLALVVLAVLIPGRLRMFRLLGLFLSAGMAAFLLMGYLFMRIAAGTPTVNAIMEEYAPLRPAAGFGWAFAAMALLAYGFASMRPPVPPASSKIDKPRSSKIDTPEHSKIDESGTPDEEGKEGA